MTLVGNMPRFFVDSVSGNTISIRGNDAYHIGRSLRMRLGDIITVCADRVEYRAKIPYEDVIKTGSNLNSEVFIEIMETIGLDYTEYEPSFVMIDEVLLKMRNEIAHGERIESINLDEKRFKEIYDVVTDLMKKFVVQITNAVYLKEYKNND